MSVRRVTLMVDPLDLVPSGDPFQLGSLYDIDTMLQFGELPRESRPLTQSLTQLINQSIIIIHSLSRSARASGPSYTSAPAKLPYCHI